MEVRFQVSDDFANRLKGRLNSKSTTDLARDAFTLLEWASDESSRGRLILAGDQDGGNLVRLALRSLDELRAKAPKK